MKRQITYGGAAVAAAGLLLGGGVLIGQSAAAAAAPVALPAPPARTVTVALPAPPARTVTVTVTPTPAPAPSGPRTTFGTGTFEVGVDIAPGKYRTAGANGCYWARMSDPSAGGVEGIIANDFGDGPRVATVKKGEFFKSSGCGVWTQA